MYARLDGCNNVAEEKGEEGADLAGESGTMGRFERVTAS